MDIADILSRKSDPHRPSLENRVAYQWEEQKDMLSHRNNIKRDNIILNCLTETIQHSSLPATVLDIGCARFYGLNWRQIIINHVFYWTKPSIFYALQRVGFRVERFSEPRYWHPNPRLEFLYHIREIGKFMARILLSVSYVPLSMRVPSIRHAVAAVTKGRLSHKKLMHKIGDQPVLGDVMFVVARPL